MQKIIKTAGLLFLTLIISSFSISVDSNASKKILGTWEYSIPDAPYEYQKGNLVLEKKDGKLQGYTEIEGYKNEIEEIVIDKKNVTFLLYVENTEVEFDLNFEKNAFKGTVSYTEGTLDISGIRAE